jgi:hypothetical protein
MLDVERQHDRADDRGEATHDARHQGAPAAPGERRGRDQPRSERDLHQEHGHGDGR